MYFYKKSRPDSSDACGNLSGFSLRKRDKGDFRQLAYFKKGEITHLQIRGDERTGVQEEFVNCLKISACAASGFMSFLITLCPDRAG